VNNASSLFVLAFIGTVALVSAGFALAVIAVRRHLRPSWYIITLAGAGGWILSTGVLAATGRLSFESMPPTMFLVVAAGLALALGLGFSRIGLDLAAYLPLWLLVGFQGFRVIVELLLHRAYLEGLAPVQMTFVGLNFDIVSGTSGGLLGLWLLYRKTAPTWLIAVWNTLGLLLLATIMIIAILSTPTPIQVFREPPANVWVVDWPWVWLPTVFVPLALLFHILVYRRIRIGRNGGSTKRPSSI
jgi:hypothetical protein